MSQLTFFSNRVYWIDNKKETHNSMTEDQKKNGETQLWGIANLLRGKINISKSIDLNKNYYLD